MSDQSSHPVKHRVLVFTAEPEGQAERARMLLTGLEDLIVKCCEDPNALHLSYSLHDYTLISLERALVSEGFQLHDSTWGQIGKTLIHYQEEVECHNLNVPFRRTLVRHAEVFVKAYENHPHGDHDDTPPELREYK